MSIFGGGGGGGRMGPGNPAFNAIAQGMAGGRALEPPTLAGGSTAAAPPTTPLAPPSAPASPAQAPSYAARAAGRAGPRGGVGSTILTSGAGLTTRAFTGQKTLLGQ